jgi:hypothetical protein
MMHSARFDGACRGAGGVVWAATCAAGLGQERSVRLFPASRKSLRRPAVSLMRSAIVHMTPVSM